MQNINLTHLLDPRKILSHYQAVQSRIFKGGGIY